MEALTLLVTTYNRPLYMQRLLRYYASEGFPYPIVIADSGSPVSKEQNKRAIEAQKGLRITYLDHYPSDLFFAGKVSDALASISTPYVALISDDDFFVMPGLEECKKFLDEHPSFSFAQGIHYGVTFPQAGEPISWFILDKVYGLRDFTDCSVQVRVAEAVARYSETMFAVYRTGVLQEVMQHAGSSTQEPLTFELFFAALSVVAGKGQYLRVPYIVRELSSSSYGSVEEQHNRFRAHLLQEDLKVKQQRVAMRPALLAILKNHYPALSVQEIEDVEYRVFLALADLIAQFAAGPEQDSGYMQQAKALLPARVCKMGGKVLRCKNFIARRARHRWVRYQCGRHLRDENSIYYQKRRVIERFMIEAALFCDRSDIGHLPKL